MKKLGTFIAVFLLMGVTAFATTTTKSGTHSYDRGYGNSFIFVENGVEFAVFPDGQFDFNVDNYSPTFSAYANLGGVGISFNTGHSYDAYVQYDDLGAVVQIENVGIFYDYYGRIVRAGDVRIKYNSYGRVTRVGGLYIHYNSYNNYSHYTGFINVYNRYYVYRPWHTYYASPAVNLCVVLNRPYRQYYTPIRHSYYRPYNDNYRPRVSYNAGRRDSRVTKSTSKRSDRYRQDDTGRRNTRLAYNSRSTSGNDKSERVDSRQRGSSQAIKGNRTVSSKSRKVDSRRTSEKKAVKKNASAKRKSGEIKRSTRTIEKRTVPKKRVVKTSSNKKSNMVKHRSSSKSKSQRVAQSTAKGKRKTTSRSSKSSDSKRSKGRIK